MTFMLRALVLATLVFVMPQAASGQLESILHIKVVLVDAERQARPVPRHALLISDNPSSAPPRRIVTAMDGTANVRLRPGNYTVESDEPVVFQGKAYQWTQMLDIVAGRDAVLELTADNAEVEPATSAMNASAAPLEANPSALLMRWQDSVVAIWTPTTHASGFVIDARGLIATNQRAIGSATSVEVQITPAVKVAGTVLAADPVRDVAILRIDPTALASVQPVPLGCALPAKPPLVEGQEIFTIGTPLREEKGIGSGIVSRVEPHALVTDFLLASGSAGGPVFAADGGVVGITSVVDGKEESRRGASRVVRIDDACDVAASAEGDGADVVAATAVAERQARTMRANRLVFTGDLRSIRRRPGEVATPGWTDPSCARRGSGVEASSAGVRMLRSGTGGRPSWPWYAPEVRWVARHHTTLGEATARPWRGRAGSRTSI